MELEADCCAVRMLRERHEADGIEAARSTMVRFGSDPTGAYYPTGDERAANIAKCARDCCRRRTNRGFVPAPPRTNLAIGWRAASLDLHIFPCVSAVKPACLGMLWCRFRDEEEAALKGSAAIMRRATVCARPVGMAAGQSWPRPWLCLGGAGSNAPVLRVCADPDNMPFSNSEKEGFENKLAELLAERLGDELEYSWFAETSGYVPNTVGNDACDLVMGYAQGTGLIEDTNPYYYTSYVLITREDDAPLKGVETLSDPRLKQKRIGLFARTPPASILAMHGLVSNAKPFETYADDSASRRPMTMIAEIASGELDAGLLWGPVGGYYAQRADVPLRSCRWSRRTRGRAPSTASPWACGPNEPQWKHSINKLLAENQHDINVILQGYNVPLLNQEGELIASGTADR